MTRDGDGMTVEVVKGDALGKEQVERHTDVRSVELPSTRGMVRLDDVVEILEEHDDVPAHAVHAVAAQVDDDPSTGGHISINSPSSSTHTALFERVDIYAAKVDNARGSATCGPDETWLHVVIPDDLDSRMREAVYYGPLPDDVYNRSTLVEHAVEELLDDTDPVADAGDDELVAELEQRGYECVLQAEADDESVPGGDRREKAKPIDGEPGVDVCPKCEGHGGVVGDVCPECEGTGRVDGGDDGAE